LADGYTGFRVLYIRTFGLMTTYFLILDSFRRHTNIFQYKVGQFFGSGLASMFAFWLVWPFEVLKNQAQAGTTDFGGSTTERAKHIYQKLGIKGFFRGIIPGSQSVFLRNGAAMVAM
jgi:solute carrier family 25 (mitochondrial carnitine/acylcarnitine transporter), member 20/29